MHGSLAGPKAFALIVFLVMVNPALHGTHGDSSSISSIQHSEVNLVSRSMVNDVTGYYARAIVQIVTSVEVTIGNCFPEVWEILMLNMPPLGAVLLIMVSLPLACIDDLMFFLF